MLFPAASFLLLSALVVFSVRAGAPAQAAPSRVTPPQNLEARVAALESELAAEKKKHEETRALLEQALAYLEKQAKAAGSLLGTLDQSEQEGFTVGENWRSRQTLLTGFRAYWSEQQSGIPKPTAAPQQKPAAPTRPARQ
jgi:hypothetical protein